MPARRPVQAAVDRRFNRCRYDAAPNDPGVQRLVTPADRAGHLTGELLTVLDQTMQPIMPSPPVS
jgi:hypothetical protein